MTSLISQLLIDANVGGSQHYDVEDAVVVLDEGHAPFATARLTLPFDPDTDDLLDPRVNPRLQITMTQRYSGAQPLSKVSRDYPAPAKLSSISTALTGKKLSVLTTQYGVAWNAFGYSRPVVVRSLNLGVRSRVIDHSTDTMQVIATSDESRLQDYGLISTTSVSPGTLTVLAAVTLALSYALPGASLVTTTGLQTITAESAVWNPGVSAWDYLSPLVTSAGLRLWCDELGVWHLADPTTVVNPGQVTLSTTNSVTAATDTVDRDAELWADAVVVKYTWVDGSNVTHVQYDVAGDSTSSRVLLVEQNRAYPRAGEAATRLRKLQGQGRALSISAVADLTAYPAMAASLSVPDTPTQTGYVSSVEWRLPDDEMNVATRGLVDTLATAWAFGPAGKRWTDVPVGKSWNAFTW